MAVTSHLLLPYRKTSRRMTCFRFCFDGSLSQSLLLFLLLFLSFAVATADNQVISPVHSRRMVPMKTKEVEVKPLMAAALNERRRRLGSFQICALCTCCGGQPKSICLPSPCCYAINCNLPNKPFGFCSFMPKSCNCFDCNLSN